MFNALSIFMAFPVIMYTKIISKYVETCMLASRNSYVGFTVIFSTGWVGCWHVTCIHTRCVLWFARDLHFISGQMVFCAQKLSKRILHWCAVGEFLPHRIQCVCVWKCLVFCSRNYPFARRWFRDFLWFSAIWGNSCCAPSLISLETIFQNGNTIFFGMI